MIDYRIIPVGSFDVNCALVSCGTECVIVDPGQEARVILAKIKVEGLTPRAILLTHCHFDHIGGVPDLQASCPGLPVYAHPCDWPMFGHPMNAFPPEYPPVSKPSDLRDIRNAPSDLPDFGFEILETPGHTPGSVCVRAGNMLFSGDTLFAGSCGRTDFPGGSMRDMRGSLLKLMQLPGETQVIPGHGGATTIARESETNPFIVR
jgi:glyoxylase-like metal-dependent hydrolase (beta-lactamase superfamily II)